MFSRPPQPPHLHRFEDPRLHGHGHGHIHDHGHSHGSGHEYLGFGHHGHGFFKNYGLHHNLDPRGFPFAHPPSAADPPTHPSFFPCSQERVMREPFPHFSPFPARGGFGSRATGRGRGHRLYQRSMRRPRATFNLEDDWNILEEEEDPSICSEVFDDSDVESLTVRSDPGPFKEQENEQEVYESSSSPSDEAPVLEASDPADGGCTHGPPRGGRHVPRRASKDSSSKKGPWSGSRGHFGHPKGFARGRDVNHHRHHHGHQHPHRACSHDHGHGKENLVNHKHLFYPPHPRSGPFDGFQAFGPRVFAASHTHTHPSSSHMAGMHHRGHIHLDYDCRTTCRQPSASSHHRHSHHHDGFRPHSGHRGHRHRH